jgi:hypothetical protein
VWQTVDLRGGMWSEADVLSCLDQEGSLRRREGHISSSKAPCEELSH